MGVGYLSRIVTVIGLGAATVGFAAESNLFMGPPPPLPYRSGTSLSLSLGTDTALMHEPPALQYRAGHAIVPFLGFGFSRGTTMDMSGTLLRGLAQQGTLQNEQILRDLMGKTMMPNEVQLGIRFPF